MREGRARQGRGGREGRAGEGREGREGRGGRAGQGNMGSRSSLPFHSLPVTSQLTFIIHQIINYQVIKSLLLGHGQSYLYGTVLDCK